MDLSLPRIEHRVDRLIAKTGLAVAQLVYGERCAERVFSKIGCRNPFSRLGAGSNRTQTAVIRREIPALVEQLGVRSVLDIPCGDFWWMRETQLPEIVTYIGADSAADLIDSNTRQYGNQRRSFRKLDLMEDVLPAADLVLCRDCLVRLSFDDIDRAIVNLKRSGSTYLLTTSFTGQSRKNTDIVTGQWRTLNLSKGPFFFPQPLYMLNEQSTERNGAFRDKSLALYRIAELPVRS